MAQVTEEGQDPTSAMETQPEAPDLKQQTPNTTGKKITPGELKDQESEKVREPYSCLLLFFIDPQPKTLNPALAWHRPLLNPLSFSYSPPSHLLLVLFPQTNVFLCLPVSLPDTEDARAGEISPSEECGQA